MYLPKAYNYPNETEGVRKLLNGDLEAIIGGISSISRIANQVQVGSSCRVQFSGKPIADAYGLAVQKNHALGFRLENLIRQHKDLGLMEQLEQKWIRRLCKDINADTHMHRLDMSNFSGLLMGVLAWMLLSVLICMVEMCIYGCRRQRAEPESAETELDA